MKQTSKKKVNVKFNGFNMLSIRADQNNVQFINA